MMLSLGEAPTGMVNVVNERLVCPYGFPFYKHVDIPASIPWPGMTARIISA